MKLATLRSNSLDGALVVVSRDLKRAITGESVAPNLQKALDSWKETRPKLEKIYKELNHGNLPGEFALDIQKLAAPFPRAYQWLDGSAYVNHVELVRKARGAEMPPNFWTDPLMYQGASDVLTGPEEPVYVESEDWGIDFEAEVAVVTDQVPMGISKEAAGSHIQLLMLLNDVSLRNLIPAELAKGFGFMQSKPTTSFSPVAVTPDELGDAWSGYKVRLPLRVHYNSKEFGRPNAGDDMTFDFSTLISHAAKTRVLGSGTIIGSGTISNLDRSLGSCCIAERRSLEQIQLGKPVTPFMKFGDRVRIEMLDKTGASIFGAIDQEIRKYNPPK